MRSKPDPRLLAALFLAAALFALTSAPARAMEPIILGDEDGPIFLHQNMDILADENGTLTFKEVHSGQAAQDFVPCRTSNPSFGFTDTVFWLRFVLSNHSATDRWYLEFGYPLLDDVRVYIPHPNGSISELRSGDMLPWDERSIPHRKPVFLILPGQEQVIYCRIQTSSSSILTPVLWSDTGFVRTDTNDHFILGLYYGVVMVMAVYNLFLFFTLRDRPYLYYVLYILAYVLFQGSLNGLTGQYLWPESVNWNNISVPLFIGLSSFCCLLFSWSFLHVTHKGLDRIFKLLMALCLLQAGLSYFLPYSLVIRFGSNLAVVVVLAMFIAGIHSLYCRYRPARYFLLAWGVFLAGQMVSALHKSYALFPTNFLSLYSGQIGSVLDVVLLSLALGDRINVIQEERTLAQEESLKAFQVTEELNAKLKDINRTLESKVEERTSELTMANEKLRELDRLKSEFLANVSHELRTPLTSILGFATLIQDKLKRLFLPNLDTSDPKVARAAKKTKRDIGIIVTEAQRLTTLINDLLDLSKMEAGRMEWRWRKLRLDHILNSAMDSLRPLFKEKGLALNLDTFPEPPLVTGDPDRLQQVVVNLLSNAAKYTLVGEVRCRVEEIPANGSNGDEPKVRVSVTDTGIGIAPRDQEYVFEKFRRVSDSGPVGGTGLGLSICREIVEHHGGEIRVESEPGQGSTFSFDIPTMQRPEKGQA